ncbi:hypothetical protein [Mangrovibacterium diazotrophicum]|uniref:Uncharacterized protein n=1 Tax=Mangrovibacterium diazotrophicum TaxID=1261403 RepID=A0A419W684_9BACT|nr:hypothetical protein [Mangrovibacterium diazotrophicum]RKD90981.1 hypothetical protein BC643_1328 [Mangrovibacterium diazotrophicum]
MRNLSRYLIVALCLLAASCLVISVHPLYKSEDLFANDLLLGQWVDQDTSIWQFEYGYTGEPIPENTDSTAYLLRFLEKGKSEFSSSEFKVHLINLRGIYFLDFYIQEYGEDSGNGQELFDLHLFPVHSFARLDLNEDGATIRWFNPDWLKGLAESGQLELNYELEDGTYLLTAPTEQLQQFVVKYANDEAAFDDGFTSVLKRQD